MSNANVHQSVGFCSGFIAMGLNLLYYTYTKNPINYPIYLLSIPIATLYSLLPDIDIKSRGSKIFYLLILTLVLYFFKKGETLTALIIISASLLPQTVPHRKYTHNLLFALIFPLPVYLLFPEVSISLSYFPLFYISAVVGFVSHLIMDRF